MSKKIIIVIPILIILLGIWSFFVESKEIKIEKISINIKNLPPAFEGIEIVHLSDFHSKNFGQKEKEVLENLRQLNPDFIFITGDFVDWTTKDLKSCQGFWQELSENHLGKVFGVLGNHDHRHPKRKTLKNLLKESGIEILANEAKKVEKNGDFIHLIGIDDPHEGYDDIKKAMAEIDNDNLKILIAHSPEIFKKIKGKDIDLVLVGHTHGGQINIPFLTDFLLPLKYDRKYKSGLFKENSTYLYVNRGIGTTFISLRFNSFPEITLITLK
jgi:predicted MPP superfamily phosphohydrolase